MWRQVLDEGVRKALLVRQGGVPVAVKDAQSLAETASERLQPGLGDATNPLWELADIFSLNSLETFTVAVTMGAATCPKLAYGFALLRQDPEMQTPSVGVLLELLDATHSSDGAVFAPVRPGSILVDLVLLAVPPEGISGLGASFTLSGRILDWWRNVRDIPQSLSTFCHLLDRNPPPEPIFDAATQGAWRAVLKQDIAGRRTGERVVVVLIGPDGCGKTLCAEQLAMADGRPLLVFDVEKLRTSLGMRDDMAASSDIMVANLRDVLRETRLQGAHLHIRRVDAWPTSLDPVLRDLLQRYTPSYSLGAKTPLAGRSLLSPDASVISMEIGRPGASERQRLWQRFLPEPCPLTDETLAISTHRYLLTGYQIETVARQLAMTQRLRHVETISVDLMDEIIRQHIAHTLASVARRVVHTERWADLVATHETRLLLQVMAANHRHRRRVFEEWGFYKRFGRGLGLSALFSGPPGTGKTMAAGVLASELGLPLYQVELSQLVSKWVGETEKNLDVVFEQAEAAGAVLLFDEADSLFARRTEVTSANDRYANLEVNHLLQRIEGFQGIVVLTTNNAGAIDQAFHRRFSYHLDFPLPDAVQRAEIWRKLVPADMPLLLPISFDKLATEFEFSGGHIKNVILRAAFFAAELDQPLSETLLRLTAGLELKQLGAVVRGVDLETVWEQLQRSGGEEAVKK